MFLWISIRRQHICWILLASAEKQLLARATTVINLKFTKLWICANCRSCIRIWNIEQELPKTMMYYIMWDYSVFRLYSSPGFSWNNATFRKLDLRFGHLGWLAIAGPISWWWIICTFFETLCWNIHSLSIKQSLGQDVPKSSGKSGGSSGTWLVSFSCV